MLPMVQKAERREFIEKFYILNPVCKTVSERKIQQCVQGRCQKKTFEKAKGGAMKKCRGDRRR